MQPYAEIEEHYKNPDPWGFQVNPEDHKRKARIIEICNLYAPAPLDFARALDIGAGEGWITKDLPAMEKWAFEISENAIKRFPADVIPTAFPQGKFELVTATGVLYPHYNCELFFQIMRDCASQLIVTCNIKDWEIKYMSDFTWHRNYLEAVQIHEEEFPYREYTQKLRVLRKC